MHRITLKNSLLKNNYNLFYYMYKNNKNKIEKLFFCVENLDKRSMLLFFFTLNSLDLCV
jgi:hypothetical protein